jgi:hypothetical protein
MGKLVILVYVVFSLVRIYSANGFILVVGACYSVATAAGESE